MRARARRPGVRASGRPNTVWVLTDDLSSALVNHMPHVKAMQRAGLSFSNHTVTDSLCCPSRSSIFTGKYPHNTGVFTNTPPALIPASRHHAARIGQRGPSGARRAHQVHRQVSGPSQQAQGSPRTPHDAS
nr:sulfatase-like hydrolase/transferase [Streptomyces atriruber]